MIPKHSTASVFLLSCVEGAWQLGLVWHPRFSRWMLPGGHVEEHENPAQTASREVAEETGMEAAILSAPAAVVASAEAPGAVPMPLWIVEERVPPEPRQPREHVHVDHLYAAFVARPDAGVPGEHRFSWHGPGQLAQLEMFDDSRALAAVVFAHREALLGGTPLTRRG
jgi:8-oxo-dGTP pyrophosphatase MutT (NUDIX family)